MHDRIHLAGPLCQIIEGASDATAVIDAAGQIRMVNARCEALFGYDRDELVGHSVETLIPRRGRARHRDPRDLFHAAPALRPMGAACDLRAVRRNGEEFPVEIRLNPVQTDAGAMLIAAIVDVSRRKREEARLRAALKEKDILLGEIHHRVKNNLQIIESLLNLQANRSGDAAVRAALRDSQNRVRSMGLIHQTLYGAGDFARIDMARFVAVLLPSLAESYGITPARVTVRVDVEPIQLPIDIAVPCALALNELASNAFRHAFVARDHGELRVALTRQPGCDVMLSVSDDGIGLPDHIDPGTADTLGLRMVNVLAEQIDATLSTHRSGPTRFSLRFPT